MICLKGLFLKNGKKVKKENVKRARNFSKESKEKELKRKGGKYR